MRTIDCFADDYGDARRTFLDAARSAGAALHAHRCPARGPRGEALFTDVATLGDDAADKVPLVISGVHGVEGFAGAGIQTAWLTSDAPALLPRGVRAVIVHAINPFGFAWDRRANEDNVDVNRNFLTQEKPRDNDGYAALHASIQPDRWTDESEFAFVETLRSYTDRHGELAAMDALTGGQHSHRDGLFYAGDKPVWSNQVFCDVLANHVRDASHVAFIDLHTGLGPYGHGELWHCATPGSALEDRVTSWYRAGLASPHLANTVCVGATYGLIDHAVMTLLPSSVVTGICMEFGTYGRDETLIALCIENWLHHHASNDDERTLAAKRRLRRAFYGQEDDWKELVALRAQQVLRRALDGLSAS